MSLSLSPLNPARSVFGGITHSLEERALHLGLKVTAKIPGDPLTKAIARQLPGGSATRTGDASWRMIDGQGRVFTAKVSGTNMTVRGQDGTITTFPIVPARVSLPSLPSLPKLPQLPGVDVGKLMGGVVNATLGAAIRQPAIGGTAIRLALRGQYPEAKVKYDGNSTWTVSNLGMEAPFQVRIRGNTVTAERNGRVLAEETITLRALLRR